MNGVRGMHPVTPSPTRAPIGGTGKASDRAQLIKIRAMAEALWTELNHPMETAFGKDAVRGCKLAYEEPLEIMLVDELNPTIEMLEG